VFFLVRNDIFKKNMERRAVSLYGSWTFFRTRCTTPIIAEIHKTHVAEVDGSRKFRCQFPDSPSAARGVRWLPADWLTIHCRRGLLSLEIITWICVFVLVMSRSFEPSKVRRLCQCQTSNVFLNCRTLAIVTTCWYIDCILNCLLTYGSDRHQWRRLWRH